MHETIVAQSILTTVAENAAKLNAKPVSATVSCGQLNPINDDALNFAFEIASAGTVCEGLRLIVIHHPLKALCRQCEVSFEFDVYSPGCTECGSSEFEITPDAPLLLEEIEFEDEGKK